MALNLYCNELGPIEILRTNEFLGKFLELLKEIFFIKTQEELLGKSMKNKLDSKFRYIKVKISGKSW